MATTETEPVTMSFDSREQEVFLNLWRTYDCLKAIEDELFARFELSPQQYNALRLLEAAAPAAMQSLALGSKLISRAPDTTRLLDRLEKRGWVRRSRPAENRRVVEVSITPSGLRLLKRMRPEIAKMHAQQLGHLSPRQAEQLTRLLRTARRPHDDASCNWIES